MFRLTQMATEPKSTDHQVLMPRSYTPPPYVGVYIGDKFRPITPPPELTANLEPRDWAIFTISVDEGHQVVPPIHILPKN